jgi:hypothetical protein
MLSPIVMAYPTLVWVDWIEDVCEASAAVAICPAAAIVWVVDGTVVGDVVVDAVKAVRAAATCAPKFVYSIRNSTAPTAKRIPYP